MHLYHYRALVSSVYDGDTITVDMDLGFGIWSKGQKIRLHRINTPELRGDERQAGLRARDYLRGLILDKEIVLQTIRDKKGKYGRYLGEVWLLEDNGVWLNVNDDLLNKGYAQFYQQDVVESPESFLTTE